MTMTTTSDRGRQFKKEDGDGGGGLGGGGERGKKKRMKLCVFPFASNSSSFRSACSRRPCSALSQSSGRFRWGAVPLRCRRHRRARGCCCCGGDVRVPVKECVGVGKKKKRKKEKKETGESRFLLRSFRRFFVSLSLVWRRPLFSRGGGGAAGGRQSRGRRRRRRRRQSPR